MLIRREGLKWVSLLIAAVVLAGCSPQSPLAPTATMPYADTLAPTASTTVTPTPRPTATETLTPTLTSTPDRFKIDMAKLHRSPSTIAELHAHPENFQEAPDPFADRQGFLDFWEKVQTALGLQKDLPANVRILSCGVVGGIKQCAANLKDPEPLLNKPDFFYFKHGAKWYAVPIFSMWGYGEYGSADGDRGTFAVILMKGTILGGIDNYDALL